MKIKVDERFKGKILKLMDTRTSVPYSWKVTSLICCPRKTYFSSRGFEWKPKDKEAALLSLLRGRAHHIFLEVLPDKEGLITKDEIIGRYDIMEDCVIEIFTTMKSLKMVSPENLVESFPLKMKQLMAYCYMTGKKKGTLLVFYLMGDYTPPKPRLIAYTVEFDEDELKDNWKRLIKNKEVIAAALKDKRPPLKFGEAWECKNCGYREPCEESLGDELSFLMKLFMVKKDEETNRP